MKYLKTLMKREQYESQENSLSGGRRKDSSVGEQQKGSQKMAWGCDPEELTLQNLKIV